MKIVTNSEMKNIENIAFDDMKIPSILLMEQASLKVSKHCEKYLSENKGKTLVIAGTGNNGGDGIACARHLHIKGHLVDVIIIGKSTPTQNNSINLEIIKNLDINIKEITTVESIKKINFDEYNLIVDGIYGTGFHSKMPSLEKHLIEKVNNSNKYVISIDIPSGVDGDTGTGENAIKASQTIALQLVKVGIAYNTGNLLSGKITLEDIGIPKKIYKQMDIKIEILNQKEYATLLPKRQARTNKGSYGKCYVLAGSDEVTGAALLSVKSAYKIGAGYVKACVCKKVASVIKNTIPEVVVKSVTDEVGFLCSKSFDEIKEEIINANSIVLGPGIGNNNYVAEFVVEILNHVNCPLVIDADGLNIMSKDLEYFKYIKKESVITPHPLEMSRLTGISVDEILENPIKIASEFAVKNNIVVLLKDFRTIIASPNGKVRINETGCSAMAKAGSGDILTGIIAGLISCGLSSFDSATLGCYIHGLSGEIASKNLGEYGVMASDLTDYFNSAINDILA